MSIGQEIIDYIPALFNITSSRRKVRCNHTCKEGKCICMDVEQLGLLRKVLSEEDQLLINLVEEHVYTQNLKNHIDENWICSIESNFFGYGKTLKKKEIKEILEKFAYERGMIEETFKVITVIYAINSSEKTENRNTIVKLSMYATFSEKYASILFQALICLTLGYCMRETNKEEKECYKAALINLFNELNMVDISMQDRLCASIDKYRRVLLDTSCSVASVIAYSLGIYQKELMKKGFNLSDGGKRKINQLYKVLRVLLDIAGISVEELPELSMVAGLPEEAEVIKKEYDSVIDLLEEAKSEERRLKFVLEELNKAFWKSIEIYTETTDDIRNKMEKL